MPKNLFLEEAVLDDLAHEFGALELPLSSRAFKLVAGAASIFALVAVGKIISLGALNGDFYKTRSLINASKIITSRAERGIIFDRNGKPLSENIPSFRLNIHLPQILKDASRRRETASLLEAILNLPPGHIETLMANVNLERQSSLTVFQDLTVEQVIKIKNLNLEGVEIQNDYKRKYFDGEIFAHILGYTGAVDKKDIERNPSLSINDTVGKSGLELYYDSELRGIDGERVAYRNAKGEILEEKSLTVPRTGRSLYLTIEADFQKFFYERLKRQVENLGSRAGVGIAMNPQNGEILALVNIPSFDNNKIEPRYFADKNKPFFNRAISGLYAPGSIIKPLVAFAALKENIISPEKRIFSAGYIQIPNPYNPDKPSKFLDWRAHGWVDMYAAIARSSDVYFYEIGGGFENQKGLGVETLKKYWDMFWLGRKTGIDLPAENEGFLPDPEIKEKSGGVWRVGDTYNVSIGQGDLLATPLELLNYVSVFANGGKLYQPFILKKNVDAQGRVIEENRPKILVDYSSGNEEFFEIVRKGMEDAVSKPYGTANLLASLPIEVAAKTGTAQIENNAKTNAFFVGYLPSWALAKAGASLDRQVAILVLIEDAREGSLNAVPVAKDIFEWYYWNRIR